MKTRDKHAALTPLDLARLRRELLWERRQLQTLQVRDRTVASELRDEASNDLTDQASVETARALAATFSEAEAEKLRLIEAALERMKMGTYGICEKTGRPIPLARLRQIPWARYRVEVQEGLEAAVSR
jgi:RNA polymerase-binding protein DksA